MNGDLYAKVTGQVQFGPVYHCWVCGEPVVRLVPYHEWVPAPTTLDRYAEHLGYLNLHPTCIHPRHPARVAVVGPAITPLNWPEKGSLAEQFRAIEAALEVLVAALEERKSDPVGGFDQALALALRLYGRVLSPAQGAEEIRTLVVGQPAAAFPLAEFSR